MKTTTPLTEVARRQRELDAELRAAVVAARRAGQSWTEVATQLGVTRQSARERFRHLDPAGQA